MKDLLDQCQLVFWEIENVVPVRGIRDEKGAPTGQGIQNAKWSWTDVSRAKARYLLGMLEALKMILSVMLQTIYLAKKIAWPRQQRSQVASEAVDIERLQLRSLVIEHQLSLIRMTKLYHEFQLCKSVASPPPHQPNIPAVISGEERCPTPHALNQYQEAWLLEQPPSRNEAEDVIRIQQISSQYCDIALQRWTNLDEIQNRLAELEDISRRRLLLTAPMDARRRSQQPTVESESEEDDEVPRLKVPKPRQSTPGPILMPMEEIDEHAVSSPRTFSSALGIPTPSSPGNLMPPQQSPRSFSTGSPINPFFPASPTQGRPHSRRSPGPSPLSSPRSSFSNISVTGDQPAPRPTTAFKNVHSPASPNNEAPPVQQPKPAQQRKAPGVSWRLRKRDKGLYWDFVDSTCIDANTSKSPPETTLLDRTIVTEIFERWVRRWALEEAGLEYMAVNRENPDSRRTKLERCWVIQRALSYPEVKQLHRRTLEMDRRDREKEQAQAERKRRVPLHPPLDRSYTAPAPLQIPHSPQGATNGTTPSRFSPPVASEHNRTNSSSSYHQPYYSPRSPHSHSSRENTESDSESDAVRRRRERSRSRARSKSRSRSYSVKGDRDRRSSSKKEKGLTGSLAKIGLAGVGVSTLLEGLPELLAGL